MNLYKFKQVTTNKLKTYKISNDSLFSLKNYKMQLTKQSIIFLNAAILIL